MAVLPPGVTQAMIDASLAANPYASTGGYMGPPMNIGGTPGTPEYNPDYGQLILSDPLYTQQRGDLSAQSVSDAARRKSQTAQALARFGEVPDFASAVRGFGLDPNSAMYKTLFGDVDQATRNTANDLTSAGLSTTAQLGREHDANVGNLLDMLAARGTVRSGATGVGLGLEDQRYGGAQFGARSSLLDYLAGVQAAFAESEQGRQAQLAQGAQDATARQIQLHPYRAAVAAVPGTIPGEGAGSPGGGSAGGSTIGGLTSAARAAATVGAAGAAAGSSMPPSVQLTPFVPHDLPLPSIQGSPNVPHDLPLPSIQGRSLPNRSPEVPQFGGAPLSAYGTPQERQEAMNPTPDAVPSGLSRPDVQALLRRLNMG